MVKSPYTFQPNPTHLRLSASAMHHGVPRPMHDCMVTVQRADPTFFILSFQTNFILLCLFSCRVYLRLKNYWGGVSPPPPSPPSPTLPLPPTPRPFHNESALQTTETMHHQSKEKSYLLQTTGVLLFFNGWVSMRPVFGYTIICNADADFY
jgi:hypothetical protein